jgi:F-type H+-transporting ATPase subunit a
MASKINIYKLFLTLSIAFFCSLHSFASTPEEPETTITTENNELAAEEPQHEAGKFNAGEMIIEHVADNHSWHLFGHTTLALPIILKTEKGLDVFSSSKFGHEGTEIYTSDKYTYKLAEGNIEIINPETNEANEHATAAMWDLSITKNVTAMLISMLLLVWMFFSVAKKYKSNPGKAPKGLQSFVEPLILFIRDDVAKVSIGEKHYQRFLPFLLTVFFFIFINNLMGLVPFFPGGVNVTGSISIAMVLAAFVLIITFVIANRHYWRHVFAMPGVPIPVLIILTPIEILGLFLRPFVLMIRLFANITAGHIIALAFFSLIFIFGEMNAGLGVGVSVLSLVFTVFMGALELLVAFLQAYVFTLLSAIYFGAALDEGHEIHNHTDDHH